MSIRFTLTGEIDTFHGGVHVLLACAIQVSVVAERGIASSRADLVLIASELNVPSHLDTLRVVTACAGIVELVCHLAVDIMVDVLLLELME